MALMARTTCPFPVGGRPHRMRGLSKGRLHWQRESREYCSEQLHWQRGGTEQPHWQRERQSVERGPRPTCQPLATLASQRSAEAR